MDSNSGSVSAHRPARPCTPTNGKNITTRRNIDRERELQQLKSRGVVSELNKTFDSQDNIVFTPASPPNPSSPNSHLKRTWRKSTSSGTTDLHSEGTTRISTTTTNQQHMLYDDTLMASPSDITPNVPPLPKTQSQDHGAEIITQNNLKDSNKDDLEQYETTLFHIDNHTSLINQYKLMFQQIRQSENQALLCQLKQQQMENSTRQILEKSLMHSEEEADKVRHLSTMALKQDQAIHELEFALSSVLVENDRLQQEINNSIGNDGGDMDSDLEIRNDMVDVRRELKDLRSNKLDYEKRISSLCNELESSQEETNRLTAMMEDINQQCHQQQLQIDEKIEKMTQQLAHKDELIWKYQQENRYYSQLVDRSSIVRNTVSLDNIPSRSDDIPPPNGPPPSSPLPALPVTSISVQMDHCDGTLEQQRKQQSSPHDLTSDDEHDEHVLTPSMEMLLLQTPSTYCLDESTLMHDKIHQEYTEQLKNRLSINKEIDHLEVWDHAALERLQQQQLKRTSLAPTTTTVSSSKWSDRSSSAFESDWDDKHGHSTFWKGMKKKLRV